MEITRRLRDYVRVAIGVDKQRVLFQGIAAAADDDGRRVRRADGGGNKLVGR